MKNTKKIVFQTLIIAICGLVLSVASVSAQTAGDEANGATSNNVDTSSLSTGGDTSNGATSNNVDTSSLSTGGDTSNGATSNNVDTSSLSTGGDTSNGAVSNPSTPSTPDTTGNSSSGSRSGSSRNTSATSTLATSNIATVGTTTFSCPLITTYMKVGVVNDKVEVAKLQAFLKNAEKLDVEINGIFDTKTDAAVRAFQAKYLSAIMGPWDATRPSGFVYITTSKQINKLACATPLTLSADELATIEAYKNRSQIEVIGADTVGAGSLDGTVASTSDEIGSTDESNVAGAADASILGKFWNFIKNLFR